MEESYTNTDIYVDVANSDLRLRQLHIPESFHRYYQLYRGSELVNPLFLQFFGKEKNFGSNPFMGVNFTENLNASGFRTGLIDKEGKLHHSLGKGECYYGGYILSIERGDDSYHTLYTDLRTGKEIIETVGSTNIMLTHQFIFCQNTVKTNYPNGIAKIDLHTCEVEWFEDKREFHF